MGRGIPFPIGGEVWGEGTAHPQYFGAFSGPPESDFVVPATFC